jgi:hypothetical protein
LATCLDKAFQTDHGHTLFSHETVHLWQIVKMEWIHQILVEIRVI